MKFLHVDSLEAAREKLLLSSKDWISAHEIISIDKSRGRIAAEDIFAASDIPSFRRSAVDGYAVVSADTAAAGESIPVLLTVKGGVLIGTSVSLEIKNGECAEIPTGGMIPQGSDAVAMIEHAEPFSADGVALYESVSNGDNIVQIGEDAKAGDLLLQRGRRIRPQDIGVLAAAGIASFKVYAAPRLTILSTGNELVSPDKTPKPGQIRDINTHALAALAGKEGFSVVGTDVLRDDESVLENAICKAMEVSDIVIVSGGSSQGKDDITRAVIDRISMPGVYTHGIAVKPGKPTILGSDDPSRTILAGLPGHPVSAMMVFELLLGWLLREITASPPARVVYAKISRNVASSPGKLTCWPVVLECGCDGYTAEPIFGKSGLITTLTKADGYFIVDRNTEGLKSGQTVAVHLF